ncbi:MAG: 50S ribosomal protein L25 [Chloroflexia bacterium]
MEKELTLKVERREITGKKVRQLRRAGWLPAVIYGAGVESVPVQIRYHEAVDAYRRAGTSTMVGILMERQRVPRPAFIREVQQDPISLRFLHMDLELVDPRRPITVNVPLLLVGESPAAKQGLGVLTHGIEEIEVHCLPADVPPHIEVDISVLARPDDAIYVRDLKLPPEIEVRTDPDTVIAYIAAMRGVEVEEAAKEAGPEKKEEAQ